MTLLPSFNEEQTLNQHEIAPNARTSTFLERASANCFDIYNVIGSACNSSGLDAAQTDFSKRLSDERHNWLNEPTLTDSERLGDELRFKCDAAN